jgi:hypothetical protein
VNFVDQIISNGGVNGPMTGNARQSVKRWRGDTYPKVALSFFGGACVATMLCTLVDNL